jgi:hypothetical protein
VRAKYMRDDDFLSQESHMGLSFEKVFIRLNICSNGGQSIKWRMVKELNSKIMYGLCHPL